MTAAIVRTPTGDLDRSRLFYAKLGFEELGGGETVLVTDGKVIVEIDPRPGSRTGLKLVKPDWSAESQTLVPAMALELDSGFLVADPNGVRIELVEGDPEDYPEPLGEGFAAVGKFVGLSVEAVDFDATVGFWLLLGYDAPEGQEMDGWAALTAGNAVDVTVLDAMSCPHLFFNPGLTYFNGENNLAVIDHIRQAEIPIDEEITIFNDEGIVDNIIIRDPGGTGFFIFND